MLVVVTYDVNTETSAGKRRLRLVAKSCMKYGNACKIAFSNVALLLRSISRLSMIC